MSWKAWAGAAIGGGIAVAITGLRVLGELATDPTAPGGRLAGMESNFPGNDLAVAFEVLFHALPLIAAAAVVGGLVCAKALPNLAKRLRRGRAAGL
jgi:hypothetical protein